MNRIALVRGKQDMTQEDLAKAMGVSRTTICAWESGKVSKATMEKIAEKLSVSIISLYGTDIFTVEPQDDNDVRWLLALLSMYAKDEDLAKRIKGLVI